MKVNQDERAQALQGLDAKKVWNTKEVALYLGISTSYLYKLVNRRAIAHFKSKGGKMLYFTPADVEAWALDTRVATTDEIKHQAERYCQKGGVL